MINHFAKYVGFLPFIHIYRNLFLLVKICFRSNLLKYAISMKIKTLELMINYFRLYLYMKLYYHFFNSMDFKRVYTADSYRNVYIYWIINTLK